LIDAENQPLVFLLHRIIKAQAETQARTLAPGLNA
jgi:hypothetical protein